MPTPALTDTQQAILALIAERIAEEGMPPSQAEIARAFGFSSVRAAQYLTLGAKARALMDGRSHVDYDDIRALAHPVLRHRIRTTYDADARGIDADQLITRLLDTVPSP